MINIQFSLSIIFILLINNQAYEFHYHDYTQMTRFLYDIASRYPTKSALYEIGQTEGGRSLWAIALSSYSPNQHILLRPEVKYIGNMHGNEVVGLELLLYLIEYLLTSNDNQVIQLMDHSRIWIMPSMNPDGLQLSQYGDCSSTNGRFTLNNIDLNRNFPDYLGAYNPPSIRALETSAIMLWLHNIPFVLSANYHGGAFIINIPYDRYYVGKVSISSDDDIYQMIAKSYVNRISETNRYCDIKNDIIGTVVHGADWYEIIGSMQDYGYLNYGTIEMTMEISCCKYPDENLLLSYWNYNRDAMIELLFQAQRGVKGLILNEYYQPISSIQVMIDDRRPVVNVTPLGEFWRILLPGMYTLKVFYRGYEIYRQQIIINDVYIPLNLTIIIPRFVYHSYSNKQIQSLSPFINNFAYSSSISCRLQQRFFLYHPLKNLKTKTAYHTHFLSSEALHQQPDAVAVPPSRGSTFSRQHAHHVPQTPSEKSSHTSESDHLPPIVRPPAATILQHQLTNGSTSTNGFHLNNNQSPPTSARKHITKTMNTPTTIKKSVNGGPVIVNGSPSQSSRTTSSESHRKVRKLWWSPRRHEIEIRSDPSKFKHVSSRIGSLVNIDHQPGGGQVSIRDDPVRWQVSSKINSLSNANWSPPPPRVTVRKEKIKWDAQPKIGSLINIDHKPAGGNIAIRDDKIDLSHVTPRTDCGFIDY